MTVVTPALGSEVIDIMRNITGRTDPNDPAFTDTIMLRYLNDFVQSDKPQDVRLFEDQTWWEFTVDENDGLATGSVAVNLDTLGYSTIQPPAYVGGFEVFWYQDPTQFFRVWPETQTYAVQRPTYILYYNDELIFRGPPDTEYTVKISANKINIKYTTGSNISRAYLDRYLAYGASLNILSDYAEMARYEEVLRVFNKHRANVLARTWQQDNNQRITPEF